MTIKTLAAAVALSVLPVVAFAQCDYKHKQAMSCSEGSVYDANAGKCMPTTG